MLSTVAFSVSSSTVVSPVGAERFSEQASGNPVAINFYTSLAEGFEMVEGSLLFHLSPGRAVSRVPDISDEIEWNVGPNTTAQVKVKFEAGAWKSLRMKFGPAPLFIRLKVGTVNHKEVEISEISFSEDGVPREYWNREGTPIYKSLSNYPELRKHLKIAGTPSPLLLGRVFAGFPLSASPGTEGMKIQRIANIDEFNSVSPLRATLKRQARLIFGASSSEGSNENANQITLRDRSSLEITTLTFNPSAGELNGALSTVTFICSHGLLRTGDTSLRLSAGTSLGFSSLKFIAHGNGAGTSSVIVDDGLLTGPLASGSVIALANSGNGVSTLSTGDGSELNLQGLRLEMTDQHQKISVNRGGLNLFIASGKMSFGKSDFITLRGQRLQLDLQSAVWASDGSPNLVGSIAPFDVEVSGGELLLHPTTKLLLQRGHLVSPRLELNSLSPTPLTGRFTRASFELAQQSKFGIADGFVITLSRGRLIAATDARPLVFSADAAGALGQFSFEDLSIADGVMKLGKNAAIKIVSGEIKALVIRSSNDDFGAKLSGELVAGAGMIQLDGENRYRIEGGQLRFKELSLSDSLGLKGSFGAVSFTLAPSEARFSRRLSGMMAANGATLSATDSSSPWRVTDEGRLLGLSRLVAPLSSGTLKLAGEGHAELLPGSLIEANFMQSESSPLKADLAVNFKIGRGAFSINPQTTAPVTGGTVQAPALKYVSPGSLTGGLSTFSLTTAPYTTNYPDALSVTSNNAGTILGGDPPNALNFADGDVVTGSYTVHQDIQTGWMKLGKRSEVNVTGGTLDITIILDPTQPAQATAALDVTISEGHLQFNEETSLKITGNSRLQAKALAISEDHGLTGELTSLDLNLGASLLSIPKGFKILFGDNSRLHASAPAQHFEMDQSGSTLYGTAVFDAKVQKFYNADPTEIQLNHGTLHLVYTKQPTGRVEGHEMSLTGSQMILTFNNERLPIDVDLTQGEFFQEPGQDAHLTIATRAVIPSGLQLDRETKCEGEADSGRTFPLFYAVKTRAPITIASGNLKLDGNRVTFPGFSGSIPLALTVKPGRGEHENERCNYEEGSGEMAPFQEAFVIWLWVCKFHLYLKPHEYAGATATLTTRLQGSVFTANVSEVRLGEELQTDYSGCWLLGGLMETVSQIIIHVFIIPDVQLPIEHDFHPPPS